MSAKNGVFLIIDPAMATPENDTYNLMLQLHAELRNAGVDNINMVQFYLPKFSAAKPLSQVVCVNDIMGIISVGSLAMVTDSHEWSLNFEAELKKCLFDKKIPFFGICYSHQLLAHMLGCKIDYLLKINEVAGKKHLGDRKSKLLSPKLRLLFSKLAAGDYANFTSRDILFREIVQAMASNSLNLNSEYTHPWRSPLEHRLLSGLAEMSPTHYSLQVSHSQEVHAITNSNLRCAATSEQCSVDAIVHSELPIFSTQGHPEYKHPSQDGKTCLKNFMYMCSLLWELKHA